MINDKIWARINELPDEQKEKLKGCATKRELMDSIAESGMELADEELEAVSGGSCCSHCTRLDWGGPDDSSCHTYHFPEDCSYECIAFWAPGSGECQYCEYVCTSHYRPD